MYRMSGCRICNDKYYALFQFIVHKKETKGNVRVVIQIEGKKLKKKKKIKMQRHQQFILSHFAK